MSPRDSNLLLHYYTQFQCLITTLR